MNKVLITYFMPAHPSHPDTDIGATKLIVFDTLEHLYEQIEWELHMFAILDIPEGEVCGFMIHPATEEDFYKRKIIWAFGMEINDD